MPIKQSQYGSHFEVTSYVLETPSGNGLLFGMAEEMSRCSPADMMKEQQRAKFIKRVAFWNNLKLRYRYLLAFNCGSTFLSEEKCLNTHLYTKSTNALKCVVTI